MKGENTMKKIIVAILGFLVGSILPIATAPKEVIVYALLVAATAIIIACCCSHDGIRFFAILIAGAMIGCCIVLLIAEWHEVAKEISLGLIVAFAIGTTAMLGAQSEDEKQKGKKRKEPKKMEEEG